MILSATDNPLCELPVEHLYRLIVDGRFYTSEHGWEGYYGREPGSFDGMVMALCYMLDHINEPITLPYLQELHKICVSSYEPLAKKRRYPGQFREFKVSFSMLQRTCSLRGMEELIGDRDPRTCLRRKEDKMPYESVAAAYEDLMNDVKVRFVVPIFDVTPEQARALELRKPRDAYFAAREQVAKNVQAAAQKLIDQYYAKIKHATGYALTRAQIDLAKGLERTHLFVDCNNRIFVNIVLNQLLMQVGELPAIFWNPGVFDGLTTEELLAEVQFGQSLFEQMISDPDKPVFGHKTSDESEANTARILEIMKPLIDKLHPSEQVI